MNSHTKILTFSALLTLVVCAVVLHQMSQGMPSLSTVITSLFFGFPFIIIFFAIPYTIGCVFFDKNEPVTSTSAQKNRLLIFSETKHWNRSYWACWLALLAMLFASTLNPENNKSIFNFHFIIYLLSASTVITIAHETNTYKLIKHLENNYGEHFKDIFYIPIVNTLLPWYAITGMKTVFRYLKLITTSESFDDNRLVRLKRNYWSSFALSQLFQFSVAIYIFAKVT